MNSSFPKSIPEDIYVRKFRKIKFVFLFSLINLIFPKLIFAQFNVIEPEPFRLEENYERDFKLDDQSFVDRFSYRFNPDSQLRWNQKGGQGFRITSGSVSNDETYTVAQLNKRWFFEDFIFGEIRHRRDEDYDSRYERTLFGTGIKFSNHYTISILGDVQAKKQNIDLHLEFSWYENKNDNNLRNIDIEKLSDSNQYAGDRIRLALILTDNFYNDKSDEGNYLDKPKTLFAEWFNFYSKKSFTHIWINYNLETKYQNLLASSTLDYKQIRFGTNSLLHFTNKFALYFKLQYEATDRKQVSEQNFNNFNRDHTNLTFEFRYEDKLKNLYFLGTHYVYFDEKNINTNTSEAVNFHDRNDFIFYTGFRHNITDKLRFRPTLYFNNVNLQNLNTNSSTINTADDLTGRIALPFEYFLKKYSATLSIIPTLEWPGSPFGGLNVQVQFLL